MITPLQQREIFHLMFLKFFGRGMNANSYVLKGGTNLRFFYKSARYSEDMDLDVREIEVFKLKDHVLKLLSSKFFLTSLAPYHISNLVPPDMKHAKQTETVQRFKIHLITDSGEDLFTKIEFSRRGITGTHKIETVDESILFEYKQPPVIVPHYIGSEALFQKIFALANRAITQARDVFDIYTLYPQVLNEVSSVKRPISNDSFKIAENAVRSMEYENYRDTVVNFLSTKDREFYENKEVWKEMQIKVAGIILKLAGD